MLPADLGIITLWMSARFSTGNGSISYQSGSSFVMLTCNFSPSIYIFEVNPTYHLLSSIPVFKRFK